MNFLAQTDISTMARNAHNQMLLDSLPGAFSIFCIGVAFWYIIGYTIYKNRKRIGDFFR